MKNTLIKLAEEVAKEAHAGQYRRCGLIPYITHPKDVARRVGDDVDAQVVAWLHDVLEDSAFTAEDLIQKGFSAHQVTTVEILTKKHDQSYFDYLEEVASSHLASKVKVADMISNLSDTPTKNQIQKYAKGILRLSEIL